MSQGTKCCRKCGQVKPREAFNRKSASPDGLQPACRECVSAYNHELYSRDPAKVRVRNDAWALANPDKVREHARRKEARRRSTDPAGYQDYQRSWDLAHPESRADRNGRQRATRSEVVIVDFPSAHLAQRLSVFPGCWICGGPKEEIDHVKPLSKGGPHMLANIRPICRSCNRTKRDEWPLPHQSLIAA